MNNEPQSAIFFESFSISVHSALLQHEMKGMLNMIMFIVTSDKPLNQGHILISPSNKCKCASIPKLLILAVIWKFEFEYFDDWLDIFMNNVLR